MGHFIFLVIHIICIVFFIAGLLLTLPLHLIYGAASRSRGPQATPATHVRCPECRELIFKEASVCRYCGCKLVPQ